MSLEPQSDRRIAIVGAGCRMPPSATSLAAFWKFLVRGGSASKALKKDRWDWRQYYDEDQNRPGKSYAAKASYLDQDVRQFDPLAFGMSPREAESLDPQQRLLLESAWEAFEDAGYPLHKMSGSSTGVFVGGFCLDHMVMQAQPSNRHLVNAHSAGGVMMTVLSNRLSHAFNLRGPSVTMDTACSSSLVALHYACQSLLLGECRMALAGGVNVMTRPEFPIIMSKGHFLSPHGECHTFDETAAGYGRGEGAGVLLLKKLEDALADGDQIHAVVRASGVNQDGHTDGISLPNSAAQEELIRKVYSTAGVPVAEVDYVEAHGTGTQAGDSAELGALHRSFSEGRSRNLIVGSVKSNIGHLEAAAGVAGVLKTIGILKNRQVPKNLHFKKPNPNIPFSEYCVEVAKETKALPAPAEKPTVYAAINSFGYGGTNAHVLLESAPDRKAVPAADGGSAVRVIPFSAQSDKALRDLAGKFAFLLGQPGYGTLEDFAHTAAHRRSHLNFRGVALASSLETLRAQFIAASTGEAHDGLVTGAGSAEPGAGLVFVYTGMGPQWWGMGQELVKTQPIVEQTLDEIDAIFQPLAGWSLKEAMMADEASSRMARTELAQPANFALQVALTRLWASYGIHPSAVVGHSVGEVASSYVAGVYSLEEAVRVSYYRSQLQQSAAGQGAMLAVGLPEADALALLGNAPGVSIAAVNSFNAVTLSGDTEQLKAIAAGLEERGIFNKFLRVEVAYHSPQMEPLREPLLTALSGLAPKPARIPLYSTGYGRIIPAEEWSAECWWHNVRQPVRFAAAIQALIEDGFASFLEVGPHPVLGNSIKECAAHLEQKVRCFVSLRRAEPEMARLLSTIGELYCAGYDPDWAALAPAHGVFLPGPQYPWQRETLWVESERSKMERLGLPGPVYLNRSLIALNPTWEVEINRNYFPFLFDHGVQDQTVFAGMGYIEAAISLNKQVNSSVAVVLENVSFERVLVVDYSKLQYLVTEYDSEEGRFSISSRTEGEEIGNLRHCRGRLLPQAQPVARKLDLAALQAKCATPVDREAFYDDLSRRGLHYGPTFRPTRDIWIGEDSYLLRLDASDTLADETHFLHPTLFDAAIQPILYRSGMAGLYVPFSIEQFEYHSRPGSKELFVYGELTSRTSSRLVAHVWLMDAQGVVHAHGRHMSLQAIDMKAGESAESPYYQLHWKQAPLSGESRESVSGAVILADPRDSDLALANELSAALPGSELIVREFAGGASRGDFSSILGAAALANRGRIILLWGSGGQVMEDILAASELSERLVALLQAAAMMPEPVVDITSVTVGAKAVNDGEIITNWLAFSLNAIGMVAQNEYDAIRFRSIDLDSAGSQAVLDELAAGSNGEIAYRAGERLENILESLDEGNSAVHVETRSLDEPVELQVGIKGKIDSLYYEPSERVDPGPGQIEVRIHASALNYKDLLKVEGRLHPGAVEGTYNEGEFGMECAGVVLRAGPGSAFAAGDRIIAVLTRGFRSIATIDEGFAVRIPQGFGMDMAAVPVVYLAAYHGLVTIANLQRGERVLIHHASGGLGMAAIEIARWRGAEIYATSGSEEKQQYLRGLGISHVYSSRTLDFGQRIREDTGNEGVDVVIGAQTGQAMHVSLNLLRTGGRYIEIGKKDIAEDNSLPLRAFNRNLIFASVDMDRLARERPSFVQQTLRAVVDHFAQGDFKPGPVRVYPAAEIKAAFAEMERSQHIGKLLVDFSQGEVEVLVKEQPAPVCHRDGSYIVTGGTSGFGVVSAEWLASQGAGKIYLVSRSGKKAGGLSEAMARIEAAGAEVEVLSVDVTDAAQVSELVCQANAAPYALRGVIHGAMVLDDAMMADMTAERFRKVFLPKVAGALNLAAAVKGSTTLDFLVFYSSISSVIGNRGQTSYVGANRTLDGLATVLRARGIPAISLNWGALAESGVVARDERLGTVLASSGITGLGNREALQALGTVLRAGKEQIGVFLMDWEKWRDANPKLAGHALFRDQTMRSQTAGNEVMARILEELTDASREQRMRVLEDRLQDVLAKTLRMSKDTIPMTRKLNEMGVDSLMVLELSLGIKEQIGLNFSAMEFLKGPTLRQLATLAESRLWGT
ncbi:type I polyketide synthase [Terrimicrobium sacchariphilum]|nr:type I polyketide synthase [Terrimicrobium sacchariphilum]